MSVTNDQVFEQQLKEFSQHSFTNNEQANAFYIKYGVGNTKNEMDMPFERFLYYEQLLEELMNCDFRKYQIMHKGIPFYFLAWLAFDLRNYEKALYYIDAAISEDVKNTRGNPFLLPASQFLLLNPGEQVASRTIQILELTLEEELARFNEISGETPLSIAVFVEKFAQALLKHPANRTIISAFYVFLLEYSERQNELRMRSTSGGSIAPFIHHLFSGSLVFESLLKFLFPTKDDNTPCKTIGEIYRTSSFLTNYPANIPTSATSFSEILSGITNETLLSTFTTITKIRNTSGHNLIWDDTFAEPSNYQTLFQQEVDAILYIILHSFC